VCLQIFFQRAGRCARRADIVSDSDEENHPWARYYAAQGRERVERAQVTKSGATVAPFKPKTAEPFDATTPAPAVRTTQTKAPMGTVPPMSGSTPPMKINWNEVPLVELIDAASQQRAEAEAETKRLREAFSLLRIFSVGLGLALALVVGVELVQYFTNDRPSDSALAEVSESVGAAMLRQFAAPGQSLGLQSVRPELFAIPEKGRANYDLLVTLELRAPLYAPADSNGAQAYLQLQQAVAGAHARVLASAALRSRPALLAPPILPMLVAQTHRRGERLVVRVPLEARRHGLRWELTPHPEQRRVLSPLFAGETMDRQTQPNLVFGSPASREEIRRLMAEARRFVLAVNAAAAGAVSD
jgi:hypothetical protein